MNISAIQANERDLKRNSFIRYANSFMSAPDENSPTAIEKANSANTKVENVDKSKGIETLTTYSIFPKQVINGHTVITA